MVTIGLCWHNLHSGNLGVGALSAGHLLILKRVVDRIGLKVRFITLGTGSTHASPSSCGLPEVAEHRLVTLPEIRELLRDRANWCRDYDHPLARSEVDLHIRADRRVPFAAVQRLFALCRDPEVRIYRVGFPTCPRPQGHGR